MGFDLGSSVREEMTFIHVDNRYYLTLISFVLNLTLCMPGKYFEYFYQLDFSLIHINFMILRLCTLRDKGNPSKASKSFPTTSNSTTRGWWTAWNKGSSRMFPIESSQLVNGRV